MSLKTGFTEIFSWLAQNLGGLQPPRRPPGPYAYELSRQNLKLFQCLVSWYSLYHEIYLICTSEG